jgi:hypothetical protein
VGASGCKAPPPPTNCPLQTCHTRTRASVFLSSPALAMTALTTHPRRRRWRRS